MKKGLKVGSLLGTVLLAGAAYSQIVYSNVTATVAYTPSGGGNIGFGTSGPGNNMISFITGNPVQVGGNTTNTSGIVNIIYEASSPGFPIAAIVMDIMGSVTDFGRITWTETIEDLDQNAQIIGFSSGMFLGASYTGGANGNISFSNSIPLSHASSHIKVKKTFTLDVGGQPPPSSTQASLTLIKQTLVPEPATFAALALGLGALVARQRRK